MTLKINLNEILTYLVSSDLSEADYLFNSPQILENEK